MTLTKPNNRQIIKGLPAVILWVVAALPLQGQILPRADTIDITNGNTTFEVVLGGNLDAANTLTYPSTQVFQPMTRLILKNLGETTVRRPRLVFNSQKNWFDFQSMAAECFSGVSTDKDRSLALWKFMRDNRYHAREPQPGDEDDDPIKLLGVYGYGMCYNTNYANAFLAKGPLKDYNSFSNRKGRHFVTQLKFDKKFMLVDSDFETFYLKSDNETIASYEDVIQDRNLIKRSQHYGKSMPFLNASAYLAYSIYWANEKPYNFGMLKTFHTLDFSLRPGEMIMYDWKPGSLFHSYGTGAVPDPALIANGAFVYATNFRNADLHELVTAPRNLSTFPVDSIVPNLHSANEGKASSFVVSVHSPFVILDGTVHARFVRAGDRDKLRILFSRDSVAWSPVWEATETGQFDQAVRLDAKIGTRSSFALYNYFLKFEIYAENSIGDVGIDSLSITTDFQVSRTFLPELRLGSNTIHYTDASGSSRNVQALLEWNESSENAPPAAVANPLFPANGQGVDSLRFNFEWSPAADSEDEIVDYEFLLSNRADMRFPLSPSFELYTSTADSTNLTHFAIPFDGMLNSGVTYYWKVRGKDARGAWGPWSNVWSFVPSGPRPPNSGAVHMGNDTLTVSWKNNPAGTPAVRYELYASDESLGFTPAAGTLVTDTLKSDSYSIPFEISKLKPFYRVIAVDAKGVRSAPSDVIKLPNTYSVILRDTVRLGPLQIRIPQMPVTYVDAIAWIGDTYFYYSRDVLAEVEVLQKPKWLSYDPIGKTFSGTASLKDLYKMKRDSGAFVRIRTKHDFINMVQEQTFRFQLVLPPNNLPAFSDIDTVAYSGNEFNRQILIHDIDEGDSIARTAIVSKPSWLSAGISPGDTLISFTGKPGLEHAGDTVITVRTYDMAGPSLRTYVISVLDTIRPVVEGYSVSNGGTGLPFTSEPSTNRPVTKFELLTSSTWLEIDSLTGVLRGTPRMTDSGGHVAGIRVTAVNGLSSVFEFTIDIELINELPVISAIDTIAYARSEFVAKIRVSDHDIPMGDTTRSEIIIKPSWLTADILPGDTLISLRGTPGLEHAGDTLLTVRVNDIGGFSERSFVIAVLDTIRPFVQSYSSSLGGTGRQFLSEPLTNRPVTKFELLTASSWLQIDSLTGSLQGLPLMTDAGTYHIKVRVTAVNGLSSESEFTIEVELINELPVISNIDEVAYAQNEYLSTIHVRDDDVLFGDILSSEIITMPSWLTADILSGDSLISLTGTPRYEHAGDTVLTVRSSDLTGFTERTYVISVLDTIRPRIQNYSNTDGGTGRQFTSSPTANRPVVQFELLTPSSWLEINSQTGALQGLPLMTDAGTYDITVRVIAINGLSSEAEFTIDVELINELPVISAINTVAYARSNYLSTIHIRDDDMRFGDIVTSEIVTKPAWLTTVILPGDTLLTLTGRPDVDDINDRTLTVRAYDLFDQLEKTYVFDVRDTIRPVVLSYSNFQASTGRPFASTPAVNRSFRKFDLLTTSSWLKIDSLTGVLHGTPLMTDGGSYVIRVRVTARNGLSSDTQIVVKVELINELPVISEINPVAYAGSNYLSTIHVSDHDVPMGDIVRSQVVRKPKWLTADILPGDTLISLTGTPSINDLADTTLTVRALDLFDQIEKTYVFSVRDTIRPRILGLSNVNGTWGEPFAATVLTSRPVKFELLSRSRWAKLDSLSGELRGIAPIPDGESNRLPVRVRAPNGLASEVAFTINIKAINSLPVMSSIEKTAYMGSRYAASILISDDDFSRNDTIKGVVVVDKPSWLTVAHGDGDRRITLTGTPRISDVGPTTLRLTVSDYFDTVPVTYNLVVVDTIKQLPLIVSNQVAIENSTFEARLAASNSVESLELIDPPAWLVLDPGNKILKGKPGRQDVGEITVVVRVNQPGGKEYTDPIPIRVFTLGTARVTGEVTACRGETARVVFSHTGEKPWNLTYSIGERMVTVNNIATNTYEVETLVQISPAVFKLVRATSWPGVAPIEGKSTAIVKVDLPKIEKLDRSFARVGEEFVAQIETKRGCGPPLHYELLRAPGWLRIDKGTGRVSGVPPPDGIGRTSFVVDLSDQVGKIEQKWLEFEVTPVPTARFRAEPLRTVCSGDSVAVTLDLAGVPPWTVTVNDGKRDITVETTSTPLQLKLRPLVDRPISLVRFRDGLSEGNILRSELLFDVVTAGVVVVSPNPLSSQNTITVDVCKPRQVVVEVFNSFGLRVARLVEQTVTDHLEIPWTIDGMPPGVYLVVLQVTEGGETYYSTDRVVHVE